jgi:hypothetical protein
VAARLRFEEPIRLANDRLAFASDHLAVEAEIVLDLADEPVVDD